MCTGGWAPPERAGLPFLGGAKVLYCIVYANVCEGESPLEASRLRPLLSPRPLRSRVPALGGGGPRAGVHCRGGGDVRAGGLPAGGLPPGRNLAQAAQAIPLQASLPRTLLSKVPARGGGGRRAGAHCRGATRGNGGGGGSNAAVHGGLGGGGLGAATLW